MSTLTIRYDAMPIVVPPRAMTLDGFIEWAASDDFPESGRISYIDGHIVIDMSPPDIETHQFPLGEITSALWRLVRELDLGEFYCDRSRVTNKKADLSAEPDAAFASWATLESERLKHRVVTRGRMAHLVGSPDWVLETVSPSSVKKDTKTLREKYHEAGIPEYWLLDAMGEKIDFQILIRESRRYVAVKPVNGWLKSRVFPRRFRLDRARNRVGHWAYTLHTQPLERE